MQRIVFEQVVRSVWHQPFGVGITNESHAKLQGCVAGDRDALVTEKDNQTYKLANKQNQSLKTGNAWSCGKKAKDSAGEPTFEVRKLSKNVGQCTSTNAAE